MHIFMKLGFFFICEHFLCVYTVKQKEKQVTDFIKKIVDFQK